MIYAIYAMVAFGYFIGAFPEKDYPLKEIWHAFLIGVFWPIQLGLDLYDWRPNRERE